MPLRDATPKVIIRSHGEGRALYQKAEERGIVLIDATCPFVARIHHLVNDTDKQVVIVGDRNHPEVLGISGWCRKPAVIVSSYEEACEIPEDDLFVVTQTTIREQMLRDVLQGTGGAGQGSIKSIIRSVMRLQSARNHARNWLVNRT